MFKSKVASPGAICRQCLGNWDLLVLFTIYIFWWFTTDGNDYTWCCRKSSLCSSSLLEEGVFYNGSFSNRLTKILMRFLMVSKHIKVQTNNCLITYELKYYIFSSSNLHHRCIIAIEPWCLMQPAIWSDGRTRWRMFGEARKTCFWYTCHQLMITTLNSLTGKNKTKLNKLYPFYALF